MNFGGNDRQRLDSNFAGVGGGVLGAVMGGGAVMSVFGCQWESFS